MRRRGRVIAVGVGGALILLIGFLALVELMLPTAIIAPGSYQCEFRNLTTQPVAVMYRQSQENTFHTTVVNHRWIEPGSATVFDFSVKDEFLIGYRSDEPFNSVGAELVYNEILTPPGGSSFEIYHGDDGHPHFRKVIDVQR